MFLFAKHHQLLIGVTGPDKGGNAAWWFTRLALFLQKAKAIRIRPGDKISNLSLDGLVIGGGADVSPERYQLDADIDQFRRNENKHVESTWINYIFYPIIYLLRLLFSTKSAVSLDHSRDEMELDLIKSSLANGIPVLGICRGAQLINVALGGTLHQSLFEYYQEQPEPRSVFPTKQIKISQHSLLFNLMETEHAKINALHHQAINTTGSDLVVVAEEDNGVIQAVEYSGKNYVLGVQWHPEYLPHIKSQRNIFRGLVEAARMKKGHDE